MISIPASFRHALSVAAIACGTTCGKPGQVDTAGLEAASRPLSPVDTKLAVIYDRSCRNCHTIAATGAPLTGDSGGWSPRMEKGMTTLVNNVVNGFGGMPPFGMCMDCDPQQLEGLIRFMAQGE